MLNKRRVILALVLVGLFVFLLNISPSKRVSYFKKFPVVDSVIINLLYPIQKFVADLWLGIKDFSHHYLVLVDASKENELLKEQTALKDLEIIVLKERLKLSTQQQVLGQNFSRLGLEGVFAQVVGYDPFVRSQALWLSQGEKEGIQVDMPVMTHQGLVGRVIKTFEHSCQVLMLVDPHFAVDVINQETRVRALVVGSGYEAKLQRYPLLTHLEFLHLGETMHGGDLLITSGLNGIYPPGIPVGNIIKIDEEESLATWSVLPVVDFSQLEQVFIVTHWDQKSKGVPTP